MSRARKLSQQDVSDRDYEMHVLLISKSRLKSSIGTSTLMAGFALVCINTIAKPFEP